MNRDDYIDLYFAETDLGPRWRLRDAPGAPSPAAGLAARKAEAALQKISGNATSETAPSSLRGTAPSPVKSSQPNNPPARSSANTVPVVDVSALDWSMLASTVRGCKACPLCRQRRQAVPGVGDQQADWLFIGEGPGAEDDAQGEPFVGPAGKLLDNMLLAIGLKRGHDVYLANAVKCRPPNNRPPESGEVATCRPYLERQIALLQPRLIVLLGRTAVGSVLGSDEPLSNLRGRLHRHGSIPVLVTDHPADLLRTPQDKARVWEDLCLARQTMRELKA